MPFFVTKKQMIRLPMMFTDSGVIMNVSRFFALAVVTAIVLSPGARGEDADTKDKQADSSAAKRFHALVRDEWEWTLKNYPTFASELGDRRYNTRWPDVSLAAFAKKHRHRLGVLKKLDRIPIAKLSEMDRVNYKLFRKKLETDVEAYPYKWHFVPLTQREGIQTANIMTDVLRFRTLKDYEDWIARLNGFPKYMEQTLALMHAGIKTGRVQPKVVMQRLPDQIRRHIVIDPAESLFYKPFKNFPEGIKPADQKRLRRQAKEAIRKNIVPAYRKMLTFFQKEYLPACYDRVGVWQVPDGKKFYEFRARKFTTTNLTPKQIHEIGLKEMQRIRKEMEAIQRRVNFKGSFKEFLTYLRTNPKFFYNDRNDLFNAYRAVSKKIDARLPKLFRRLPKIPYDVKAIPMHIAPDTTTAYYQPPAADGSRGGVYYVNLYKLSARPKYEMEALTCHEAEPGHHLQIALAMELENLPKFRRYEGYTAFVEGWGLYSERLGEELGMYDDPYAKMGQLTYQMWRALRLVVDTGMHYYKWDRQRAIDLMLANTPKSQLDIENEIDRYIAWPGQALAYKIGELKILELRARAEKQLGKRFDIREFHDIVLSGGAVTLDILEARVNEWLREKRK